MICLLSKQTNSWQIQALDLFLSASNHRIRPGRLNDPCIAAYLPQLIHSHVRKRKRTEEKKTTYVCINACTRLDGMMRWLNGVNGQRVIVNLT